MKQCGVARRCVHAARLRPPGRGHACQRASSAEAGMGRGARKLASEEVGVRLQLLIFSRPHAKTATRARWLLLPAEVRVYLLRVHEGLQHGEREGLRRVEHEAGDPL
jgi:hypothetical protein